jgi:hypothetical protein
MNHEVMGLKKMKLNFTNLYLRGVIVRERICLLITACYVNSKNLDGIFQF